MNTKIFIYYLFFTLIVILLPACSSSNNEDGGVQTDNEKPTITCPDDIAMSIEATESDAVITYEAPVGSDNVSATTTQIEGLPSGESFPIGTTTNTFKATDAAGNSATCSFDVVVTMEAPSKNAPYFIGNDPTPSGKTWTKIENMSDEFEGTTFDDTKWHRNPASDGFGWIGRPPGLFESDNVTVSDGNLNVTTEKFTTPKVVNGKNFTHGGAIVRSKNSGGPGTYYECKMKANKTIMSSTFWLSFKENCPRKLELDIQECVGRVHSGTATWANNFDNIYHSNIFLHKRNCNGVTNDELRDQKGITLAEKNHSRYFVYGCWWKSPTEVLFYIDGEFSFALKPPTNYDIEGFITMAIETYDWNPVDEAGSIFDSGSFDDLTTKYDWVRTWKLEDK